MWLAFFLLQCSKSKGHPKFKYQKRFLHETKEDIEKRNEKFKHDISSDEEDIDNKHSMYNKRSCLCCCCCRRYSCCKGDRLVNFLIYDFFCFCLAAAYIFFFAFGPYKHHYESQIRGTIVFVQVIYGLLNFPFIIFALESCVLFMSRSRETGYDEKGNCLPKYMASYMYKLRFHKKLLHLDSKGIHLRVQKEKHIVPHVNSEDVPDEG